MNSILAIIKEYIINAKQRKNELRGEEKEASQVEVTMKLQKSIELTAQKSRSAEFLISEVTRLTDELQLEFCKETDGEVSDEEILRRKEDLPSTLEKMNQLSSKFQQCLETIPEEYENKDEIISSLKENYEHLLTDKESYEKFVVTELREREIEKEKSFQATSINIKLSKFSGYDSDLDIYSFQCEFEKLHLKTTPKKMLSDLLKYNYLKDPALALVKSMDNIDEIWIRLKKAYGDSKVLLNKKLQTVQKIGPLNKLKGEQLKSGLIGLINGMTDLISLAKFHHLEGKLYYGEGIDIIYNLMGDQRVTKWLNKTYDKDLEEEDLWQELILFLDKELKIQQELSLIKRKYTHESVSSSTHHVTQEENNSEIDSHVHLSSTDGTSSKTNACHFCLKTDHIPQGRQGLIQYYSCKQFVEMSPLERFKELRNKGFCYGCLYPGAPQNSGNHKDGLCQKDYVCRHPAHDRFDRKKHVLVCHEHRNSEENIALLEAYKTRFITHRAELPDFSKDIKLSLITQHSYSSNIQSDSNSHQEDVINDNGIYMIQRIKVDDEEYNVFFDSGCSDMVIRHDAVVRLGDRAKSEFKGPISIGGVGNIEMESKHGVYRINLPLLNGKQAVLAGVCLDRITSTFPHYPIQGKVKDDIYNAFNESNCTEEELPKLPEFIGGDIDIMIGAKYLRYHPDPVFSLTSGLTVFKSVFPGVDGNNGIVGGPHPVFTQIDQNRKNNCQYVYFVPSLQNRADCENCITKCPPCMDVLDDYSATYSSYPKDLKYFESAENACSEISYRCTNCRNCQKCKQGEHIQFTSIKEEVEQEVINQSVIIDFKSGKAEAKLPFMENPIVKLAPNKQKALAIYNSQLKKLAKCEKSKSEVIKSEQKLQEMGFVDYVRNLSKEDQLSLKNNPIQNFIPWNAVWKENSISTPCRVVFNASMPTDSGISLNDLLAKGKNNMNNLVDMILRWRTHLHAFHTDIQKMYNSVALNTNDWCFQRYIWQKDLDHCKIPEEKVIKTLIYGIKSSGNQAERALRMTTEKFKKEFPRINEIVNKDVYVDDCISGEPTQCLSFQTADELTLVLMHGGFCLKGFTFSGSDPPKHLSEDGESVNVAGMKWLPKRDQLQLDIGPIDFSKKYRGKKTSPITEVPSKLTRRQCVSKVAEIFDLTGLITPITASMKIDLHVLVQRKLDWDDLIPNDLISSWKSNFKMINELSQIQFKRAVVPQDAVNLDVETIECGDASKEMICIAIYVRFLRKSGDYSCQLLFARSKLVPEGMTIPRAELFAANLNSHTGEIVKKSLGSKHKSSIKLTDSQVSMHWLNNEDLPLKQWVHNKVVDTLRFSTKDQWHYVKGEDMPADIGTRKGATVNDVSEGSAWLEGFPWMKRSMNEFPIKSYQQIKQACKEASEQSSEVKNNPKNATNSHFMTSIKENAKRYEFSQYVIDPNRFRFQKVIRVLALVYRFIKNCREKREQSSLNIVSPLIKDEELQVAMDYFFRKATLEIKMFQKAKAYEKISVEKNGILYYSGRILPTQSITNTSMQMTDVMIDLSETTFCVPLVESNSPIASSIVNEIHWHHNIAQHAGNETVLRYTMKIAYIIGGRDLVKAMRKSCPRCKFLLKRTLNVAMGSISDHQLTIAPPFYVTQADIVGPFKAYSSHNKRNTIKIWLITFCCVITSTTDIRVMEDYSSMSFTQAFIRLSCVVGYPKLLLIDEGSQLKKGCETMRINFRDVQHRLNKNLQVEFETCPVGGHNFHGKVERKIRMIRESIEKTVHNERLSIIHWETLSSQISNSANNMPIALTNSTADLENADLITPNRLRLGRNNERSPIGTLELISDPVKLMQKNNCIFNTWFESWLISYVPNLMQHPKWYDNDRDLKIGDIVLFLKSEKEISNDYQYGMIADFQPSKDGKVRVVNVKYRNHSENIDRFTKRSSRQIVVIHPVDEINIIQELGKIAIAADTKVRSHEIKQ